MEWIWQEWPAELRAADDLEAAALWVKVSEEVAVQQAEASHLA